MKVQFTRTTAENELMVQIIERNDQIRAKYGAPELTATERKYLHMDLSACNANGCPLHFAALLAADEHNFVHDVEGISEHMDRQTGQLKDHFLPRFAREQ